MLSEPNGDGFPYDIDEMWPEKLRHWPLGWRDLNPRARWFWFEQTWADACMLRDRYRLMVRAGWWEDDIQVEVIAALAAWAARYDSGEWDDPPGKLALLHDLKRAAELLREGSEPFNPERDRLRFVGYLIELGCEPPTES